MQTMIKKYKLAKNIYESYDAAMAGANYQDYLDEKINETSIELKKAEDELLAEAQKVYVYPALDEDFWNTTKVNYVRRQQVLGALCKGEL